MTGYPELRQVVLDTTDVRGLAEFYRELLGFEYRAGDETPVAGEDWLVLRDSRGPRVAFQKVAELPVSTWPEAGVPQQLHLDLTVGSTAELAGQHERVLRLGGRVLYDRSGDAEEPLWVFADPAGHPFCVFVGESFGRR